MAHELTPLERAESHAEHMTAADTDAVSAMRAGESQTWALISIARSLEAIAEGGVEMFELDVDGHRRYR